METKLYEDDERVNKYDTSFYVEDLKRTTAKTEFFEDEKPENRIPLDLEEKPKKPIPWDSLDVDDFNEIKEYFDANGYHMTAGLSYDAFDKDGNRVISDCTDIALCADSPTHLKIFDEHDGLARNIHGRLIISSNKCTFMRKLHLTISKVLIFYYDKLIRGYELGPKSINIFRYKNEKICIDFK